MFRIYKKSLGLRSGLSSSCHFMILCIVTLTIRACSDVAVTVMPLNKSQLPTFHREHESDLGPQGVGIVVFGP